MNTEDNLPFNFIDGSEKKNHHNAKGDSIRLVKALGSPLIVPEHLNGDIVFWLNGQKNVIEPESTANHCLANVLRDERNGASSIITVALDFATLAAIARRFSRELPPRLHGRVGLMSVEAVRALAPK